MRVLVIDDVRWFRIPYDEILYARNLKTATAALFDDKGWDVVYLDHDLNGFDKVSTLTQLVEENAYNGILLNIGQFVIHSANPVGRAEMYHCLAPFYNVRFARAEDLI